MLQDTTQPYLVRLHNDPNALRKFNQQSARFWSERWELIRKQISDPIVMQLTMDNIHSELRRGVFVKSQKTFEQTVADVVAQRMVLHQELSRKGGRAPKIDTLQKLIIK